MNDRDKEQEQQMAQPEPEMGAEPEASPVLGADESRPKRGWRLFGRGEAAEEGGQARQTRRRDFSHGVETEEYDNLPEPDKAGEAEEDGLAGKECVETDYSFNGAEITQGLKIYQRDTIFKKNLVYSIILLAIFLVYTVDIVRKPSGFSALLAALCLAVLFFLWYLPWQHVKKTAQAADSEKMEFHMAVYDNCIRIRESGGGFLLHYKKEVSKVFETPELFLFCAGKERVFLLPKRFLDERQIETVRGFLREGLGEFFVELAGRR